VIHPSRRVLRLFSRTPTPTHGYTRITKRMPRIPTPVRGSRANAARSEAARGNDNAAKDRENSPSVITDTPNVARVERAPERAAREIGVGDKTVRQVKKVDATGDPRNAVGAILGHSRGHTTKGTGGAPEVAGNWSTAIHPARLTQLRIREAIAERSNRARSEAAKARPRDDDGTLLSSQSVTTDTLDPRPVDSSNLV